MGQLPFIALIGTALPFVVIRARRTGCRRWRARPRWRRSSARVTTARSAGAIALGANGRGRSARSARRCSCSGSAPHPSVFWLLAASLVLASLSVLIAGAGVKAEES